MQIMPSFAKFSKLLKKGQKAKQNMRGRTTSETGQIFTIWPQKGEVPNPGSFRFLHSARRFQVFQPIKLGSPCSQLRIINENMSRGSITVHSIFSIWKHVVNKEE